jgi:hypothetical protein
VDTERQKRLSRPCVLPGLQEVSLMFDVEHHGTIALVRPYTTDVREWLEEHTEGQWFGGALVVEPRYLGDLVTGMIAEGFTAQ